jgi:8-oxo-dGTP diphosphatase
MSKISLTVDTVLLTYQSQLKVLLVERRYPPFQGSWALPGGFVEENETLYEAALRELEEETSVKGIHLFPIAPSDGLNRDPRGRTISMIFLGITTHPRQARAGSDAKRIRWWPLQALPPLAFDHYQVIQSVQAKMQSLYNLTHPLLDSNCHLSVAELLQALEAFCQGRLEQACDKK